jgi:hypothetical protein
MIRRLPFVLGVAAFGVELQARAAAFQARMPETPAGREPMPDFFTRSKAGIRHTLKSRGFRLLLRHGRIFGRRASSCASDHSTAGNERR